MGRVRPTRRGAVTLLVVLAAFAMAFAFGTRTLDVVYITATALLAVTAVGVARLREPETTRRVPEYGAVGDTLTVEVAVDAGKPVSATVTDDHGDGVDADAAFETIADGRLLTYDLHLRERGIERVGPLTVSVGDVFGLWERTFEYEATDRVVVYPKVRPLYGSAGTLSGYVGLTEERGQFDGIRGYERGDALRDVNWKASAKRPDDLVVTEYAGEGASSSVTVAVESESEARVDDVAEAAASLVGHLLDGGLAVGVVTPERAVEPGTGSDHRRDLLETLARFGPGQVGAPEREAADGSVSARGDHVVVRFGESRYRFRELVGETETTDAHVGRTDAAAADGGAEVDP